RIYIHRAHRVGQRLNLEPLAQRVEYGVLYAVVGSQAADPNLFYLFVFKQLPEVRAVESGIAVGAFVRAFGDNRGSRVVGEVLVKFGARRSGDAVNRPGAAIHGEVFCLCRMPIASLEDRFAATEKLAN